MRRLRAAIILASVWAVACAPLGVLLFYISRPSSPVGLPLSSSDLVRWLVRGALSWAVVGAINGALFAGVLALAERRRSLATLGLGRVMLWGALGSLVVPTVLVTAGGLSWGVDVWSAAILPLVMLGTLGAACAAATLVIARRAPS